MSISAYDLNNRAFNTWPYCFKTPHAGKLVLFLFEHGLVAACLCVLCTHLSRSSRTSQGAAHARADALRAARSASAAPFLSRKDARRQLGSLISVLMQLVCAG